MSVASGRRLLDGDEEVSLRRSARDVLTDETAGLAAMAGLGWLGLLAPESAGGSGWQPVAAAVLAEEAGRAMTSHPLSPAMIATALLTRRRGDRAGVSAIDSKALVEGQAVAVAGRATVTAVTEARGPTNLTGRLVGSGSPDGAEVIVALDDRSGRTFVLEVASPGLTFEVSMPASDDLPVTWTAHLDGVTSAELVADPHDPLASQLPDVFALLGAADALGVLAGARARLTDYLGQRHTFGRPVAANQAVQHRLVDLYLVEQRLGALVRAAAATAGAAHPDSPRAIMAAASYAATHVVPALDECMQLSGGIGFTWAYPLRRQLWRAMADRELFGSSRRAAHRYLSLSGWDGDVAGAPTQRCDWNLSADQQDVVGSYRHHVRQVIARQAPARPAREGHRAPTDPGEEAVLRHWFAYLFSEGLSGDDWPARHGGGGHQEPWRRRVVTEEILRARVPRPVDQSQLAASVLLRHGTQAQQDRYLPAIRTAAHVWCQLLSEPDAGSDIAAVRTRGDVQPDGGVVVTGQKCWITDAHWADMGLALVRTDPASSRHHGLTMVMVPMQAPGVEVRPMRTINGAAEINEVFLDNVAVPQEDVIGSLGSGWAVIMDGLEGERFGMGANLVLLDQLLEDLRTLASGLTLDGRPALDEGDVRQQALELMLEAAAASVLAESQPMAGAGEAAALKLSFSETYHRISAYGTQLGASGTVEGVGAATALERLTDSWLWSRAYTVSGGSSEMMRNILARRTLNLPTTGAR